MASFRDIVTNAAINILSVLVFFLAFALLRLQPFNDRVYFPKWYIIGRRSPPAGENGDKFVNLDLKAYLHFLNWIPEAIRMPELALVDHAGLDAAIYIRIYLLGLKLFVPMAVISFIVLVPVNWTGGTLGHIDDLQFSNIDKLSISNIQPGSNRFWAHLVVAYLFTFWTLYILYIEYKTVASMRLQFLATAKRRPDQYTVLVRNIPPDTDESVSEHVEHFFSVNHHDHYLTHQVVLNANKLMEFVEKRKSLQNWLIYYEYKYNQNSAERPRTKTGFLGLWGKTVDAINYYKSEIDRLKNEEVAERERVIRDPNTIMPVSFVSFRSRWGAAVCAQTQQTSNPTIWLTEWAPEPRDVYWENLAIPFVELTVRRLIMSVALFFLIFFYMIPITFVQTLANIEGIEKVLPFLRPIIEMIDKEIPEKAKKHVNFRVSLLAFVLIAYLLRPNFKSLIQGFLPGLALKIFLILLPIILMIMSKVEGYTSLSALDRRSASKYHLFLFVNVFLGSVIAGTAFEQLDKFMHQSADQIPKTVGVSIPMKATFFITYIMVDGWSGIAAEIIRVKPLVVYHLKNTFLVKTEQDREQAMDPGDLDFASSEPRLQLYFLLGLVYAVVTPIILPFLLVFFALSYVVFRHQVINVYNQQYESGAKFWPDVHKRIISSLIVSQLLLMGLMSTRNLKSSTPIILVLPVLTIWFFYFCKNRFEPAFVKLPLQDAVVKDTLERANEPTLNLRSYLHYAYIHPVFHAGELEQPEALNSEENSPLVTTKRTSRLNTPMESGRYNFDLVLES